MRLVVRRKHEAVVLEAVPLLGASCSAGGAVLSLPPSVDRLVILLRFAEHLHRRRSGLGFLLRLRAQLACDPLPARSSGADAHLAGLLDQWLQLAFLLDLLLLVLFVLLFLFVLLVLLVLLVLGLFLALLLLLLSLGDQGLRILACAIALCLPRLCLLVGLVLFLFLFFFLAVLLALLALLLLLLVFLLLLLFFCLLRRNRLRAAVLCLLLLLGRLLRAHPASPPPRGRPLGVQARRRGNRRVARARPLGLDP